MKELIAVFDLPMEHFKNIQLNIRNFNIQYIQQISKTCKYQSRCIQNTYTQSQFLIRNYIDF